MTWWVNNCGLGSVTWNKIDDFIFPLSGDIWLQDFADAVSYWNKNVYVCRRKRMKPAPLRIIYFHFDCFLIRDETKFVIRLPQKIGAKILKKPCLSIDWLTIIGRVSTTDQRNCHWNTDWRAVRRVSLNSHRKRSSVPTCRQGNLAGARVDAELTARDKITRHISILSPVDVTYYAALITVVAGQSLPTITSIVGVIVGRITITRAVRIVAVVGRGWVRIVASASARRITDSHRWTNNVVAARWKTICEDLALYQPPLSVIVLIISSKNRTKQ